MARISVADTAVPSATPGKQTSRGNVDSVDDKIPTPTDHGEDSDASGDTSLSGAATVVDAGLKHITSSRPKQTGRASPTRNPVRELATKSEQDGDNDSSDDGKQDDQPAETSTKAAAKMAGAGGFRLPVFTPGAVFALKKVTPVGGDRDSSPTSVKSDDVDVSKTSADGTGSDVVIPKLRPVSKVVAANVETSPAQSNSTAASAPRPVSIRESPAAQPVATVNPALRPVSKAVTTHVGSPAAQSTSSVTSALRSVSKVAAANMEPSPAEANSMAVPTLRPVLNVPTARISQADASPAQPAFLGIKLRSVAAASPATTTISDSKSSTASAQQDSSSVSNSTGNSASSAPANVSPKSDTKAEEKHTALAANISSVDNAKDQKRNSTADSRPSNALPPKFQSTNKATASGTRGSRGSIADMTSSTMGGGAAVDFATLRTKLKSSPHSSKTDLSSKTSQDNLTIEPEFASIRNKLRPLNNNSTSNGSNSSLWTATSSAARATAADQKATLVSTTAPPPGSQGGSGAVKKLSSLINRWESGADRQSSSSDTGNRPLARLRSGAAGSIGSSGSFASLTGPAVPVATSKVLVSVSSEAAPIREQADIEAQAKSLLPASSTTTTVNNSRLSATPSRAGVREASRESISSVKPSAVQQYTGPILQIDESAKLAAPSLRATRSDTFVSKSGGGSTPPLKPLLVQLKGKRRLIPKSVEASLASLNQTDCFILDIAGTAAAIDDPEKPATRFLYACSGPKTPKVRRTKAIETANLIKDLDYAGKAEIMLVDLAEVAERSLTEKEQKFWETLNANVAMNKQQIIQAIERMAAGNLADDSTYEAEIDSHTQLLRYNGGDSDQKPQVVASSGRLLSQSQLDKSSCFVLDSKTEVFVWSGKSASDAAKAQALAYAQRLDRPVCFQELQNFERTIFKLKFDNWQSGKELSVYNVLEVKQAGNIKPKDKEWRVYDRGSDARKVDQLDILRMYDKDAAVENAIVRNKESMDIDPEELINRDWGFKSLRVWCVHGLAGGDRAAVTPELVDRMEVQFSDERPLVLYSEECYIFSYEYSEKPANMSDPVLVSRMKITKKELQGQMKEGAVMYNWIGEESRVADQGLMAHITVDLESRGNRTASTKKVKARHVRVLEGKEPEHFLNMLRGESHPRDQPPNILDLLEPASTPPCKFVIVLRGSRKSAASSSNKSKQMFHTVGVTASTLRITQLSKMDLSSLCSGHSYLLFDGDSNMYVWHGAGAFTHERTAVNEGAKTVAKLLGTNVNIVVAEEGREPASLTSAFGALKSYDNDASWRTKPSLPAFQFGSINAPLASSQNSGSRDAPYNVRVWRILSFVNGNPTAMEIAPFRQQDLEEDGVYVVDTYYRVYVWIGREVARSKKPKTASTAPQAVPGFVEDLTAKSMSSGFKDMRLALDTAARYADYVCSRDNGRLDRTKAIVVQSGLEPQNFKSHFWHWSDRYADETPNTWPSGISVDEAVRLIEQVKYSGQEVQSWSVNKELLPFGVDPEHLENHVVEQDLAAKFGMDGQKFSSLPAWRQIELKRKSGYF